MKILKLLILLMLVSSSYGCKTMQALTSDLKDINAALDPSKISYNIDVKNNNGLTIFKIYERRHRQIQRGTAEHVARTNSPCSRLKIIKSVQSTDKNDNIKKWVIVGKCQ